MSKTDIAEEYAQKAQELDADDPVRRGILEKLADWLLCRKTSRRVKIWDEVEQRYKYLKY